MVLVVIKHEDILNGSRVPRELVDYVLPSQWNAITDAVRESYEQGNFWSCAIEVSVCVCFVFPCIFLCHACISGSIIVSEMQKRTRELNVTLFQGQPVLSVLDGNIYVNTDYIMMGRTQTQYINRSTTGDSTTFNSLLNKENFSIGSDSSMNSGNPIAATVVGPSQNTNQDNYVEVFATPVIEDTVKSIIVTIPAGAGPGSILTVVAPNGTTISVVAPPGSYPGKEIVVQY